ncbi:OmpA family protein [Desulfoluna sp.]|uniref:OmpA family protein n=1 Tax=Desulfoluna sp. TaxID=2045199 RepID=UPI00262E170B|nr:OmpA family protein [Desulfoluna sp.]
MTVCVLGFWHHCFAGNETRDSLFQNTEELIKQAKEKRADLFSPEAYEDAMESYQDAVTDYEKGRNLKGIRKELKNAEDYLARAMEVCVTAEVTFATVMKARDDASVIDSEKYSPKLAHHAESTFQRSVSRLEGGDVDKARELAGEAEVLFREAELATIKQSLLGKTRRKVAHYKDLGRHNNAPKTFLKAARLLEFAEESLDKNRYNNAEAVALVKEAEYELAHTEFTHIRVGKLDEAEYSFEDVIIDMEMQLGKIAEGLGVELMFDRGVSGATWQLLDAVQALKAEGDAKDREIAVLKSKIVGLDKTVASLSKLEQDLMARKHEAEEALKRQKDAQRLNQMKIKRIREAFTPEEGKVLMDGDNIIIRLYGLSFSSGKAVIDYKYFALLAKVRDTFKEFPGCSVVIEGHTDSLGSDKVNKRLSKDRADSVRHYLIANSLVTDEKISSVGYGESKPVASNETREGRASNRRIDVVILPGRG